MLEPLTMEKQSIKDYDIASIHTKLPNPINQRTKPKCWTFPKLPTLGNFLPATESSYLQAAHRKIFGSRKAIFNKVSKKELELWKLEMGVICRRLEREEVFKGYDHWVGLDSTEDGRGAIESWEEDVDAEFLTAAGKAKREQTNEKTRVSDYWEGR